MQAADAVFMVTGCLEPPARPHARNDGATAGSHWHLTTRALIEAWERPVKSSELVDDDAFYSSFFTLVIDDCQLVCSWSNARRLFVSCVVYIVARSSSSTRLSIMQRVVRFSRKYNATSGHCANEILADSDAVLASGALDSRSKTYRST